MTKYTAYEFFTNRTTIGTAMQISLNSYFNKSLYSTIEFF